MTENNQDETLSPLIKDMEKIISIISRADDYLILAIKRPDKNSGDFLYYSTATDELLLPAFKLQLDSLVDGMTAYVQLDEEGDHEEE